MKKLSLLFVVLLFSLSNIIAQVIPTQPQIFIPGRAIGLGTHVNANVFVNGYFKGIQIESTSSYFGIEYFESGEILYQNNWTPSSSPYFSNPFKVAAVGNPMYINSENIGKLKLFISNMPFLQYSNLSTSLFDGENWGYTNSYFKVLDIPYNRYGHVNKSDKPLDISDAIKAFPFVGTIPANDTIAVCLSLSGNGSLIESWDMQLLLDKIVDSNAYWPIFGNINAVGKVVSTPVNAEWRKFGNKYGLFSTEKITNGDLIAKNTTAKISGTGSMFKQIDKKIYFINQNYSVNNPILIANAPVELSGTVNEGRLLKISSTTTAVQEKTAAVPTEFKLEQNYPNPFNPTTTISYSLPNAGFVNIKIYDILGKEVAMLVNEQKSAGKHEATFDASKLTSGMYVYTIKSGNFSQTKKMILIK